MLPSLVRAGVAGLMLCALASPSCAQTPNVKLTVDFSIQGQQSPFVLAAEGGYFARAGVNVEVDRGLGRLMLSPRSRAVLTTWRSPISAP